MITTENIITEQAQVGDATIRSAAIVDVDAGKLRAGSTMSGSILVDGGNHLGGGRRCRGRGGEEG